MIFGDNKFNLKFCTNLNSWHLQNRWQTEQHSCEGQRFFVTSPVILAVGVELLFVFIHQLVCFVKHQLQIIALLLPEYAVWNTYIIHFQIFYQCFHLAVKLMLVYIRMKHNKLITAGTIGMLRKFLRELFGSPSYKLIAGLMSKLVVCFFKPVEMSSNVISSSRMYKEPSGKRTVLSGYTT